MGRVVYCTREEVMDAFDVKEAASRSSQVDSAIRSASDDIDGWLNRHKHGVAPVRAIRYFGWPTFTYSQAWRLWLDENEAIELDEVLIAGRPATENVDYYLEPVNTGPPFTFIEINLLAHSSFDNQGTYQRAIKITGTWGLRDDRDPAGTLQLGGIDASTTSFSVSNGAVVGVGSMLSLDDERVLVTDKATAATGVTITADVDEYNAAREIPVSANRFFVGEYILIGEERMRILDVKATSIVVERAAQGSVLSSHASGDAILAYRQLTVERGAQGSTAASHSGQIALTTWRVPDLIRDLCRAEAITRLEQEWSAYGARVYSDEAERDSSGTEVVAGRGLTDLRKACARRYKRKFRKRAV